MNDPETSSDGDIPGEDPMMDALLAEVFGKSAPPDLSSSIMQRLRETPIVTRPSGVSPRATGANGSAGASGSSSEAGSPGATASSKQTTNWMLPSVLTLAALAASVGLVIVAWNVYQPRKLDYSAVAKAPKPSDSTARKTAVPKSTANEQAKSPSNQEPRVQRREPRGITIASDAAEPHPASTATADTPGPKPTQPQPTEAVQLVSAQASQDLAGYWAAVGVQPSSPAPANEIQSRLKARLHVEFQPTWFGSGEENGEGPLSASAVGDIESALRAPANAEHVALAWLQQITGGAVQTLATDQRQSLVTELAESFQGQQPLDQVIAHWLRGEGAGAAAWYAAVTRGGEFATVHRLASLTMNVDLRCTRCHDALIESDGRQHDYWSFAALLRRDLTRDEKGRWSVRADESTSKPSRVFYERLDGRQSVADPMIPAAWLANEQDDEQDDEAPATSVAPAEIKTVRQWSDALIGSRSLAQGVVNSLWRLVHDRPLRGSAADASTPPMDDALVQLEALLVDDFVASGFDASRLLAIILASPATSRSIPEMLVRQDAWALDADQVRLAEQAVQAFAATAPSPKLVPLSKRVDISMRSIGATLKGVDAIGPVLAQPLDVEAAKKNQPSSEVALTQTGFPDHAEGLPVQWLASIEDFDSRVKHLGYLAVAEQLPPSVATAAQAMQKAEVPTALTLQRVWWLLQP